MTEIVTAVFETPSSAEAAINDLEWRASHLPLSSVGAAARLYAKTARRSGRRTRPIGSGHW